MNPLGNRIEFPLNGKIYFKKGVEAFELGKKEKAIKYLEKAFDCTGNSEVNLYYAFVLSVYQRYEEALAVMNEKKEFYKSSVNHASFYVEILIKNNLFLEAEYIIQKYQLNPAAEHDHAWKRLEQELDNIRLQYNLELEANKKELKQSLRELANYSSLIQSQKVGEAELLDLSELQELAPLILVNHQLDGKARRAYLELLIQRKDENDYPFLWFDEIRTVCPIELEEFGNIKTVKNIQTLLERKLAKYPELYYWVEAEVIHDLLLLYPYIDEVITNIDFWLDLYIMDLDLFHYLDVKPIAKTDEEKKMKEKVEYFHQLAQRGQFSTDN